MKKFVLLPAFLALLLTGLFLIFNEEKPEFLRPLSSTFSVKKVNYAPYSLVNLKKRSYFLSQIKLEKVLAEEETFTSWLFSFNVDGRRVTGMANLPQKEGKLPVAILVRGWVDENLYQTGMGSQAMAGFLAKNGFLTLAPDFLGYGDSDEGFSDMLLARFFRPVTVITLLESLENFSRADEERVVFWGHSNGGQIVLSVLEVTGRPIPASLWAPVSAPFPDSILYFAPELPDEGKKLKEEIEKFEQNNLVTDFSIGSFWPEIKAPLIIHQGLKDEAIPSTWSKDLAKQLQTLEKEVEYFEYPQENHNFNRGSAPAIREKDLEFFLNHLDNSPIKRL